MIKENRFHHVRVGRKMLVPKNSFIDWLEGVIHR
nr:helix-turn-helix domain-containing protein [Paenibacillus sp. Cedars]